MVRKVNKNGDPMWECQCKTGEKVWVNKHTDPAKDKFVHFVAADFAPVMLAMTEGQRIEWRQFPIQVEMAKDGDFWRLLAVSMRLDGQVPDVPYVPKPEYWQGKAKLVSLLILSSNVACWDTETTGTDAGAEIISLGCVNANLSQSYSWSLRPTNLKRVALTSKVHQIQPEQVAQARDFNEAFSEMTFVLHNENWLGYNIKFDIQMLDQECERRDILPVLPKAVFDAMELVAWYRGEWDAANARWKVCKLVEAAEALGVEFHGEAHDALNDAITTMMLVRKMAGVS
jgi:DNA polymerase III epsilon subunit-like protein